MRFTAGWQADSTTGTLRRASLERRELRPDDIAVRVEYCGVCHSDLHALQAHRGDASGGVLVPGHEFTGVVTEVGGAVSGFSPGDPVAVGNIVDSCGACPMCRAGQENFCHAFPVLTYGGTDRRDGSTTLGGYSREYVVRDHFAYLLPAGLDAAPLLCAGVTVWEPMQALGVGPGSTVAVAGLGGLGHLAVKMASALGATVTVISRSPGKADEAHGLGASGFVVSTDPGQMGAVRDQFDVVVDTISAPHDLAPYLRTVTMDGTLSLLGHLGPVTVNATDLLIGRKKLSASGSGGRPSTSAMLRFCAAHGITADIELLPSSQVNQAHERLERNDVRYRFVLDMSDLDPSS
ncbi:NAD(P)-dependent alcohol dehydrogenase [Streptomyces sp. WMMB 322]|uniref:NAD(P)-dependent alcohol dehydrogenase n=1 Tax=Streptomyces sp. WMMB 322 TaxID=1286821 RepID=UPI0006E269D9|nr:NAD(P)-dependent alcohol dehydrogenase [Streptomyces sp. WMMB 322]SCK54450.1 uncharacterized zinc-type alcohol dehydrogenase-like protein [Streptomyces sp. WMMB 322]